MDEEAFERVAREQKDRVYSYAVRLLSRPAEAEDVVQEALVRLWRHGARIEAGAAPFWLRRTVHNLCIDALRRRRAAHEAKVPIDEGTSADPRGGPARLAQSAELGRLIERALSRLSPRDRAVLLLREVQGLPYGEIAGILDVPLGTLKARLHRAREQLRARLLQSGVTP
jgi:RNA polymerase sigma-70 factor (ECF subfamily)